MAGFWERARRDGWLYSASMSFHALIPPWLVHLRWYAVYAITMGPPPTPCLPPLKPAREDLEVRPVTFANLESLTPCGYSAAVLGDWLASGARGWMIERDNVLLACYWLQGKAPYYLYDWLAFRNLPTDVWILWWWVAPAVRRTKLGYVVRLPGNEEYRKAGFTRRLSVIDVLNQNACKAANQFGARPTGRLVVFQILGVKIVYWNRRLHFRWWSKKPLELAVDTQPEERNRDQRFSASR